MAMGINPGYKARSVIIRIVHFLYLFFTSQLSHLAKSHTAKKEHDECIIFANFALYNTPYCIPFSLSSYPLILACGLPLIHFAITRNMIETILKYIWVILLILTLSPTKNPLPPLFWQRTFSSFVSIDGTVSP